MKTHFKIIGIVVLVLIGLYSCKKNDDAKPEKKQTEQMYAVKIKSVSPKGKEEGAIVIGTKEELNRAFESGKSMTLERIARKNNIFSPKDPVVGPGDPSSPDEECWTEINNYYEAHYGEWLELANLHCTDVYRCLTCPKAGIGLFVMYVIHPTSLKCTVKEAY